MPRNFFYIFITLGFPASAACLPHGEAESEKPRESVPAADLIKQADELYRRREDSAKLPNFRLWTLDFGL